MDTKGDVDKTIKSSLSRTTAYAYTPDNQVAAITVKSVVNPAESKVTAFSYDAKGNMVKRTETGLLGDGSPYTYATAYTYTTNGQVAGIDGPRTDAADTTSFSYDAKGNLASVTQPLGLTTTYAGYTQTGRPQTVTDPNGVATAFTYDSLDRVKTVTIAGDATSYSYTPSGKVAGITLPKGNAIAYTYDSLDRLVKIADALGNSVNYSYDSAGNRTKEEILDSSGALQKTLSFQHDALNRLTRVVSPDSTYTEYAYDARGSRVSLRTPNSQLTSYQYDSLNRLVSVTQPGNIQTAYAYTVQDGLSSVTDANGNATTYKHDDMGRVYQVVSPDTGTTTYQYDPGGNLVGKTDAKGTAVSYQYDAANRLARIDFPGDGDIIYAYDACSNGKGRLCSVTDQSGAASYEYSPKGELTKETKVIQGRSYVTNYSFDRNGNLASITYPSGRTVNYALDTADRVASVMTTMSRAAETLAEGIAHKPYGPVSSLTYGNGLPRTVSYDQQYRISSITTGSLQSLSYTHDPNGNITKIADNVNPTKTKTFGYDALDRLTSAGGPWGSLSWTYDGVGNRTTQVENGATSNYTYQAGTNRLQSVAGPSPLSFTLDANGSTTSENAKTYTFNQNNRLIKAAESGTTKGEYTYNASGQRAAKTAAQSTTVFHYDLAGQLIAESSAAGSTIAEYVHLNGQPLAKIDSGDTRYVHTDHLGTPVLMTNASKAVVWQIESKPFGDGASITGSALLNLRFPGQYFDSETGLHQNWFRDYMPKVGRYVEADPLSERVISPEVQTQEDWRNGLGEIRWKLLEYHSVGIHPHRYSYVDNQPLARLDSTGLVAEYGVGLGIMYYYYQQMKNKNWKGADKYYHCLASCKTTWVGVGVSFDLGAGREVSQYLGKGEWDPGDWKANFRGLSCPPFQRCEDRCKPLAPLGMPLP